MNRSIIDPGSPLHGIKSAVDGTLKILESHPSVERGGTLWADGHRGVVDVLIARPVRRKAGWGVRLHGCT